LDVFPETIPDTSVFSQQQGWLAVVVLAAYISSICTLALWPEVGSGWNKPL
jgi:hypothetical protein